MKRLHFYQLPRHIQDHFIQACSQQTVPRPIAFISAGPRVPWRWLGTAALGALVLITLLGWGYGELNHEFALAPQWLLGVYGGALGAAAYSAVQAAARWQQERHTPFKRGKYLFPGAYIDASQDDFAVVSLSELQSVELVGDAALRVSFSGGLDVVFKRPNAESAARAKERVIAGKREVLEADLKGDDRAKAALDPLLVPRFSNPLGVTSALKAPVPAFRKWWPAGASVVGLLLGMGLGLVRNTLSERRLFASAVNANDAAAYQAYLERGGKRPEVADHLLPTSELEHLRRTASLEELERYSREHPDSKIRAAIDVAVRESLLLALSKAKQAQTVTALDEFTRIHSGHELVLAEVRAARLELLTRLAERFEQEFAADTPELPRFMRSVLTTLAARGPEIKVRFLRIVPDSVVRADNSVRKDPHFAEPMLPSQYFDAARSKAREERLFASLEQRFKLAFPQDALRLTHAAALEPNSKLPTQVTEPTLIVSHSTNMGSGIGNLNPSGTFVGVGFLFRAHFLTPGWETPLEIKYSTWKPPDLLKLRKGKLTIADVYLSMADAAFEVFEERLVLWLFRKGI